jgi:acetyl-CoA carboxylase/biotin carboxylase 1
VIVSPGGLDDYQGAEDFLRSVKEILDRCFAEDPPKHVKFTVRYENGRGADYYMFRPTPVGFAEDLRFRGLDPLQAHLLEMQRWVDWELTKHPNDDRSIHVWAVRRRKGNELDERLTARTLVGNADVQAGPEGLSLPDFADSYRRAVQLLSRELDRYGPKERPPLNHLFFNILPVIQADFDVARSMIEAAVAKQTQDRVSPLVKVEVLAKVRDKTARRGYRDVILLIDHSGPLAAVRAYFVHNWEGRYFLVDWNRFLAVEGDFSQLGVEDFKPMGAPYVMKTDLEKLRAARQASGNVYVYDRPRVIQNEIEDLWRAEGLTPPPDVFESTELVLRNGTLHKTDRGPMQNDRSMVGWHMKVRYPEDDSPRDVVVLSSDLTHENGTVSPKEGEFYNAVLDYAVREGIPYGQILEGFGARMGLDPNLALPRREGEIETPPPLQFEPKQGFLYLTEKDYERQPHTLESGSSASKLGDLVEGEWVEIPSEAEGQSRRVFRVHTIIGGVNGLNQENLSQGSGRMGGALERAYEQIPTMTMVVDTVVGILTYLARVGRRVIQVTKVPQLLTGNRALNKLYNRLVFATNREIGDGSIMLPNGVAQYGAKDEKDAIREFVKWLRYLPRRRGEEPPVKAHVPLDDRDVGKILLGDGTKPGVILDVNGRVQAYDPRLLFDAIFDRGEFQEVAAQWAKVVVAGRTRIGGIPVGVVGFDPRTQTLVVPADPTDPAHRERRVPQAGSVWHPDAAHKTAQMLFDFEREGLPKVILANVKGFPGGSFDMGPGQVTKFGAMIVESLVRAGQGRRLLKPTIVIVLPFGEIRGGADVVVDSYLNRESLVMLMDEHGEMSVLPREGMYEVPAIGNPFKEDNRWPDSKTKKAYWDAVIAAHQTARRALRVGSVAGLIETPNLRRDIHLAVISKQAEVYQREEMLAARSQLLAIAHFHGIPVLHAPDGGLIVGAYDVFGSDETRARFEELMQRANATRS